MHNRAQREKPPASASEAIKGLICFFTPSGAQECTTMHNDAQPNPVFHVHNSAQKPETYRRPEPKIGRNDPCPCGSGRKYKHCCLNQSAAAAA